jgi:hypothetical protein
VTGPEVTTHALSIAGQVTDAVTGAPIPGARVAIVQGPAAFEAWRAILAGGPGWEQSPERLDLTSTRADGSYRFLDLPAGLYRLEGSAPHLGSRYGTTRTGSIRVWATRDAAGRIKLDPGDVALPPTRIHGRVTNQADGQPIAGAKVRLRGDSKVVLTGSDGGYVLAGLLQGTPTIQVSARNFTTATQAVSLTSGQDQSVDIPLTPA